MSDTRAIESIRDSINLEHIDLVAGACSSKIAGDGWAAAMLTPGDCTQYHVIVTPNEVMVEQPDGDCAWERRHGGGWIVSVAMGWGAAHVWHGGSDMEVDYVAEHWVLSGNLWTAVVLTEFLNALGGHLNDRGGE